MKHGLCSQTRALKEGDFEDSSNIYEIYYIDAWKVILQAYGHACPNKGSLYLDFKCKVQLEN